MEIDEEGFSSSQPPKPAVPDKPADSVTFDLGNLAAFDSSATDAKQLSGNQREANLRELSRDNTQLLVNQLFGLETEPGPSNQGRLAHLPAPSVAIPREKPVPKPKEPTKWEKFAAEKGIQKRKRSRMVFDEETEELKPRWSYKRAKDDSQQWAIDAKQSDELGTDPWEKMAAEKRERVEKNKKQQLANLKAATGNRAPGTIDLTSVVDAKPGKRNQQASKKEKREKSHVDVALSVVQKSTGSMGKFDEKRALEPERKPHKAPRRDAELQHSVAEEKKQSLSILNRVLGKATEAEKFNVDKAANAANAAAQSSSSSSSSKGGGSSKKGKSRTSFLKPKRGAGGAKGGRGGGSKKGGRGRSKK